MLLIETTRSLIYIAPRAAFLVVFSATFDAHFEPGGVGNDEGRVPVDWWRLVHFFKVFLILICLGSKLKQIQFNLVWFDLDFKTL